MLLSIGQRQQICDQVLDFGLGQYPLQIVLAALGVVVLGQWLAVPQWLLDGLMYAIALTVLISGTGYVREWGRRAAAGGAGNVGRE